MSRRRWVCRWAVVLLVLAAPAGLASAAAIGRHQPRTTSLVPRTVPPPNPPPAPQPGTTTSPPAPQPGTAPPAPSQLGPPAAIVPKAFCQASRSSPLTRQVAEEEGCEPAHALTPEQKHDLQRNVLRNAGKATVTCGLLGGVTGKAVLVTWSTGGLGLVISGALFGAAASVCIYYVVEEAAGSIELGLFDPPDQHVTQIALPRAMPPLTRKASCRRLRGGKAATCRQVGRLIVNSARRTSTAASLHEAIMIALNRFETAKAAGDVASADLQGGVVKTYLGSLAAADRQQQAAERALAAGLRRAGLRVRASAKQMQRLRRRLGAMRGLPPSLAPRLASDGLDAGQIQRGIASGLDALPARSLDLRALLTQGSPTQNLDRALGAITFAEVEEIVAALAAQGAVPHDAALTLSTDLEASRVACDPGQRAAGVTRFLDETQRRITGPPSALLRSAALALKTSRAGCP